MCPSQTSLQFWQRYIYCGRGQNVTSSSKCEQTWQSGYIFTSRYELEDELVLPSYNNSLSGELTMRVRMIKKEKER